MTLIQTGKIKRLPIVIMGTHYWREMLGFIQKLARVGMISAPDTGLAYATDSISDAIEHIRKKAIEPFGLKRVARKHLPWLGERACADQRITPGARKEPR